MNFDLTSSLLELVATYSSIMILLSQVDDRRLVSERERGGGRGGGRGEGERVGGGRERRGRERGGGREGEGREGEGGRERGERGREGGRERGERERRIAEHISARQPNPGCILAIMRTYYMLVMLRNVQLCTRKNRAPCMCMRQPWPAQGKTCASAF